MPTSTVIDPAAAGTSPDSDFRLLRLILIDSYSPGGEAIVRLDDGAIFTGENGSGKTSLIRLVPLFFGENPGRVTVGTEGFADFYLARSTSYIIFEYLRRDVVCQAVLYAGHAGSYTYRFLRCPYDIAQFLRDDGKTLIQNTELGTHLKTIGIVSSRALVLSEYRAIIQGRHSAGKDAAIQRAYVKDYAFTAGNHRLDHIDKIISGMFKRQADFKDFLRMVVSYISEDERDIAMSGDRARIGMWPVHMRAYQEVMRHRERMTEISAAGAKLDANESALQVLHAKLLVLIDYHDAQQSRLAKEHAEAGTKLDADIAAHQAKLSDIQEKEFAAAHLAKVDEEQVERLRQQHAAYRDDKIGEKADVVDKVADKRTELGSLRTRKGLLLGTKADIDQRYAGLALEIEKQFVRKQQAATQENTRIAHEFAPQASILDEQQRQEEQALREAAGTARDSVQANLNQAIAAQARWQAQSESPAADPAAEQTLQTRQTELEQARQALTVAAEAQRQAENRHKEVLVSFREQEERVLQAERAMEEQRTQIDTLIRRASPGEDSLLHFLRAHRPGWTGNIAKLIDPALLDLTDLSPSNVDEGQSLYGLSLDLSRINTPLFADEARLEQAIQSARARLADLQRTHTDATNGLAAIEREREAAVTAMAAKELAHQQANRQVATLTDDERAAARAVKESRRRNKVQAMEQAAALGRQVAALQAEIATGQTRLKEELSDVAKAYRTRHAQLNELMNARLGKVAEDLAAASVQCERGKADLDAERIGKLSKENVDTTALQNLEDKMAVLEGAIEDAERWAGDVAAWRVWTRNEWPRVPILEKNAAEQRKKESHHKERAQTLKTEWEARLAAETLRVKSIADGAKHSADTAQQARTNIPRLFDEYTPDPATRAANYEPAWVLEDLTSSAWKLLVEQRDVLVVLKKHLREIKAAFRTGHGSPTEQYFETTAASVDPDDDQPRAWIEPLRQWYHGRHEEFLRTLLLEAQSFGRLVNRFHSDLVDYDRKIKEFNGRMRSALSDTNPFQRISYIDVRFDSTITRKAYWEPIRAFVEEHQSWISGLGREMPPPSFAAGLTALLEHWELREGIKAERLGLIDVRGEVVENGKRKAFSDGPGLMELSSNGLSYLILTTICVAFLRMIRGGARTRLTMAVDELRDLDKKNIGILVKMLGDNGIDLVSACPDAEIDVLIHFKNRYIVTRDGEVPMIQEFQLDDEAVYA